MKRGLSVIEALVLVAVIVIVILAIYGTVLRARAVPEQVGQNIAGQQTWKVPKRHLQDFQARFERYKIVSMVPITETWDESAEVTGYMIVVEPFLPPDTKPEAEK